MTPEPEVLVVGGGPGGAAAAYWLARRGHKALLVEKGEYPRPKTCGDGLTPRAVHELEAMGFDFAVELRSGNFFDQGDSFGEGIKFGDIH